MKLKIAIYTYGKIKSIYADDETNEFSVGDTIINKGSTTFIHTVVNLVKDWPEQIVAEEGQGRDVHYKIAYEDNGVAKVLEADGVFPKDFHKLSSLIFSYEDPIAYQTQKLTLFGTEKGGR